MSAFSNILTTVGQFFQALFQNNKTMLHRYVRDWYNLWRRRLGTNGNRTGLGDIVGIMGPFGLISLLCFLLALRNSGKAKKAMLWSVLAFIFDGAWYFYWLQSGTPQASWPIIVCCALAVFSLLLFVRAAAKLNHTVEKSEDPAPAPAPAENTDREEQERMDTLHREMAEIERQLEEVKRAKAAFSGKSDRPDGN